MTLRFLLPALALACACLAGCGDDSDDSSQPAAQPGTVNQQVAKAQASTTITAVNSTRSGNGLEAVSKLQSAAQQGQSIVTPSNGSGTTSVHDLGVLAQATGDGSPCACSGANSCTFDGCTAGGVTISGTLSWTDTSVKCTNIKYVITSAAGAGATLGDTTINLDCDLTFSPEKISGSLHSSGSTTYNTQGYSGTSSWDCTTKFNDVTYANGNPTGGSIDVTSTSSTTTNGQNYSYSGSSNIKFP